MLYTNSKVFGKPDMVMEGALKNPNQYRDAVLFEALSSLDKNKINEFTHSKEAKHMLNEEMISSEVLDRLVTASNTSESDGVVKATICHMAKENGDELWDDLVRARMEERRIFNDLITKYGEDAKALAESAGKEFLDTIPSYFRN